MSNDKINQLTDSWRILIIEIVAVTILTVGIVIASIYWVSTLVEETIPFILAIILLGVIGIITLKLFIIAFVRLYRFVAPKKLRNRCRYTPTCSHYMIVSLRKHIFIIGLFKGLRRISRCHPPYGGIDRP